MQYSIKLVNSWCNTAPSCDRSSPFHYLLGIYPYHIRQVSI